MSEYRIIDGGTLEKEVLKPCAEYAVELAKERASDVGGDWKDYLDDCIPEAIDEEIFSVWENVISCYVHFADPDTSICEEVYDDIRAGVLEQIDE